MTYSIEECDDIVKNLLLKLRTLLVVLLIIAGAGIIMWFIGTIGQLAKNDSGIKGSIAFAILGMGIIFIFAGFIVKHIKVTFSEKDTENLFFIRKKYKNKDGKRIYGFPITINNHIFLQMLDHCTK